MTLIIYTWFILTTKLDLAWNIAIMIMLIIYFFYENKKNNDYKNINNDTNLSSESKNELYNILINTQKSLLLGIFGITLTGTFIYGIEKYNQYGPSQKQNNSYYLSQQGGYMNNNSFNMVKFLFH